MEKLLRQLALANANQLQTYFCNRALQPNKRLTNRALQFKRKHWNSRNKHQQQIEAIIKQFQQTQQTEAAFADSGNIPSFWVSHLLPMMTADDDTEMFLTTFKRTVEK